MKPTTPTLADVAKLAGVSNITVSRVIRNVGPVAEDTQARVKAAIDTLEYLPNRAARSLATSGSLLIGVLMPSLSNIVFPEVLRGIHEALALTAFQPLIGVTDYDTATEQRAILSLLAWKPAAVILTSCAHTDATRQVLVKSRVSVAELMDIDVEPIGIAVGFSHRSAGYDTGRHLLTRGYRRFGYVGHDWNADRRARLRFEGLCAVLAEAGLSLSAETRTAGPSSISAGKEMLDVLLRKGPKLDVVVFSNDDMAVGGFFHCLATGIAVKEELGLFGFNGLEIGQALPMALSTVQSNRFLIGKTAVEKLFDQAAALEGNRIINTGYQIIEGSTA